MALVVNTNLASISAQRFVNQSAQEMETAMERLSSGKRINSAKDDAAGSAIATRMDSLVRAHEQGKRNIQDGISMIETATAALDTQTDMLQRMRELAIQSSNGSNSASERIMLNSELDQLKAEFNEIANSTKFNGKNLLNGAYLKSDIQTGANMGEQIALSFGDSQLNAVGAYSVKTQLMFQTGLGFEDTFFDDGNQFFAFGEDQTEYYQNGLQTDFALSVEIAGGPITGLALEGGTDTNYYHGERFNVEAGEQWSDVAARINSSDSGVTARAINEFQVFLCAEETTAIPCSVTLDETIASTQVFLQSGNGQGPVQFTLSRLYDQELFADELASQINALSGTTGVSAAVQNDNITVILTQADGHDVRMSFNTEDVNEAIITVMEAPFEAEDRFLNEDDTNETTTYEEETILDIETTNTPADTTFVVSGRLEISSGRNFRIQDEGDTGAIGTATDVFYDTAGTANMDAVAGELKTLGMISVVTQSDALDSISIIDGALENLSFQKTTLGAVQNRLEFAADYASDQIMAQSAARSRIEDADYAVESASLAKQQVLQQVSTAMLAQANAMPNVVLSLLGG